MNHIAVFVLPVAGWLFGDGIDRAAELDRFFPVAYVEVVLGLLMIAVCWAVEL